MKVFDLGELRKSAKIQDTSRSKSISDISKSPRRTSCEMQSTESFYLSRWGANIENKKDKTHPWVNIGQGIFSVAVGEKHSIILNNKNECYACGNNTYGQLALDIAQTTRPVPISALKDMRISAVYCGSYHSFVQNTRGEVYAFGLNMKGQLGIGTTDNEKKPILVYSLIPGGAKNPKALTYLETYQYQKRVKSEIREPFSDITSIDSLVNQIQQKQSEPVFHLSSDESILSMACGPLHSLALSSKGRVFACGYGQNFVLGLGEQNSPICSDFKQIKFKGSPKIQKIQTGLNFFCALGSNSKLYICGKIGREVYQSPTQMTFNEDIKDFKCSEENCIILTKKGELHLFGLYHKETGDQYFSQSPRKIEKIPAITAIFGGLSGYFAVAENKSIWGWGDNQNNQITGVKAQPYIHTPTQLKIPIYGEQSKIMCGVNTTYLLAAKPLDLDYERYETPPTGQQLSVSSGEETSKKELTKKKSFIKSSESKNFLDEFGIEPRSFDHTLEIDFNELIFDKQISEGGYGIIYKGKWRETTVAIKIFKIQSESAVRDFFSECAAMEALRHPNIVMFLGACTKPPNLAIVLQYCARGSLWSTIQNLDIPLAWEDRRRFALDTARGVHYLHSCNPPIIHRDLKSLNLLIDDSFRVKLADFGWTKGLDKYMTGKIGTYQWMAPEVIASEQYSEKADVFSFGIILWQIASREPPYRSLTGVQVSMEVLNNDLRPNIPKKTPEGFARLMKKCWDRDPQKRPSFKEIIKELESLKF